MKRVLLILLGVAGVVAVAVALLLVSGVRPVRTSTTVGGMQVELLQALPAGKQFTTAKEWHALAKRLLPSRYQSWIPSSSSGSCSSGSNSITVYLQVTPPNDGTVTRLPWENYRAESLDGEIFSVEGGSCSFGGGTAGAPQIYGLSLRSFPRREREFLLRFTKYDGTELGSIKVPNPTRAKFPEWTPRPLPQTATNGDVLLTLKGVVQRGSGHRAYLIADYDLVSTNTLWAGNRVTYSGYSDATGNEGLLLSFKEPAWKVTATVHRKEAHRLLDSEKLILTNLVAPDAGAFVLMDNNAVLAGVGLRVATLSGPAMLYRTNSTGWAVKPLDKPQDYAYGTSGSSSDDRTTVEHWGYGKPFLILETDATAMTEGAQLFYRAFGEDGRELGSERATGYRTDSRGWQTRAISFDKWTNGTVARLEILLSRPKVFEFVIDPADVETNEVKR